MIKNRVCDTDKQCFGSGSVGSVTFWLPGSGHTKMCGSMDLDPRAKYQPKTERKKVLLSKPKSELLKKARLLKFPDF